MSGLFTVLIKLLIYGNTTSLQLISHSVNRTSSLFRVDQRVSATPRAQTNQLWAVFTEGWQRASCLVVINTELVAERGGAAVNFTRSIKLLVSPYILTWHAIWNVFRLGRTFCWWYSTRTNKFASLPVESARGVLLVRGVTLGMYHSVCLHDVRNSQTNVLVWLKMGF